MKTLNNYYRKAKLRKATSWLLVVITLGIIGTSLALFSHAVTPTASFEAEDGSLSNGATVVSTSGASAGQAVQFNAVDPSGVSIPDTNYSIPAGAIFMSPTGVDTNAGTQASPVRTLSKAISLVPSNGTIVVRGGTYRDGSTTSISKAFTIQAYPHEQAWFDGSDVVSNWTSNGSGKWYTSWNTPTFCNGDYYDYPYASQPTANTGPCAHYDTYGDPANPAASDPQMVFIDGAYIHEVTSLAAATGNNFYYDQAAKRLYIGTNPAGHTVELAARPMAISFQGGSGSGKVRGLGFKRYATNEYNGNATHGAILVNEPNMTLENNLFTQQAAAAVTIANPIGVIVRTNIFYQNGFNGVDSNGHFRSGSTPDDLLIDGNMFDGNNTERFGTGCSASCGSAGSKLAHMNGFILKNNIFQNQVGVAHGFWCDLACSEGVMINNTFRSNGGSGLYYEVSDTGIIASNLMHDNGGYGLKLGSANTKVYNNTMVNNGTGALIYDDDRSLGVGGWTDVGPDTDNVDFFNNIISDGNSMFVAWRTSTSSPNTGPNTFFSGFDHNSFYRPSGSPTTLVSWKEGTTSLTTTNYNSRTSFNSAKGWESQGHDITTGSDPFFVNLTASDYHIRTSSVAYNSGKPLPSDVAAALGLTAGQTISRGAISWPN